MKKINVLFNIFQSRKKFLYGFVVSVILILSSCQELSEINKNPNQLVAEDINIKYILTSVLTNTSFYYMDDYTYPGGRTVSEAMQYLQRDYIDFQGANSFVWTPVDFYGPYLIIKNCQYIFENADRELSDNNQKFYTAVGQIMRSFWYGFLTSLYGDIPYTEAMRAEEGLFMPVYDAQKDIFAGVLNDLKSANELLATVTSVEGASASDILFQGDVLKWRKFANSLRLRYLLRLSEKITEMSSIGIDVKAEFNQIISGSSSNPIFTSIEDNASLSYLGTARNNSWFGGPLYHTNRSEFYRRKPCATFVDALKEGYDPRLTTFIRPVDTQLQISDVTPTYQKLADGQIIRNIPTSTPNANELNTSRYVGLPPALQDPNLFNLSSNVDFNAIKVLNPDVYTDLAANPGVSYLNTMYAENAHPLVKTVLMSYSELNFILTEASLKGWITSGNSADYFRKGITASMQQYNISSGDMKVYDPNTDALVAWDEGSFIEDIINTFTFSNDSEKYEQFLTQKWIACFMTPEFWFDWRRTGIPNLGANLIMGSNGDKIPVRFIYPDNEKINNSTNITEALKNLQPAEDSQWSKMWLLQGTNTPW